MGARFTAIWNDLAYVYLAMCPNYYATIFTILTILLTQSNVAKVSVPGHSLPAGLPTRTCGYLIFWPMGDRLMDSWLVAIWLMSIWTCAPSYYATIPTILTQSSVAKVSVLGRSLPAGLPARTCGYLIYWPMGARFMSIWFVAIWLMSILAMCPKLADRQSYLVT